MSFLGFNRRMPSIRFTIEDEDAEEKLPLDADSSVPVRPAGRRNSLLSLKSLGVFKDVALLIISLIAIIVVSRGVQPPVKEPAPCDCGDSTAEARRMGCEYDTMSAAWLPQHCIDKELMIEFDRAGDGPGGRWQYWADGNHTREYSIDEVAALADTPGKLFYTTPQWHFGHCFFYMRKIQRARYTGVTLERGYDNERHTKHCGEMFANPGMKAYSYVELKSSNPEPPDFIKDLMPDV